MTCKCGRTITEGRLRVLPETRTCVGCSHERRVTAADVEGVLVVAGEGDSPNVAPEIGSYHPTFGGMMRAGITRWNP